LSRFYGLFAPLWQKTLHFSCFQCGRSLKQRILPCFKGPHDILLELIRRFRQAKTGLFVKGRSCFTLKNKGRSACRQSSPRKKQGESEGAIG